MKDSRQSSMVKQAGDKTKVAPGEMGKRKVYVSHTKIFNNPDFGAVGGDPQHKKWIVPDSTEKDEQDKSKSALSSPPRQMDFNQ